MSEADKSPIMDIFKSVIIPFATSSAGLGLISVTAGILIRQTRAYEQDYHIEKKEYPNPDYKPGYIGPEPNFPTLTRTIKVYHVYDETSYKKGQPIMIEINEGFDYTYDFFPFEGFKIFGFEFKKEFGQIRLSDLLTIAGIIAISSSGAEALIKSLKPI